MTFHDELCCVVTSCWLEDEGKVLVSGLTVNERTVALQRHVSALKDGTGSLIETLEPRQSPGDSNSYTTEGIDKTKNCDNGLVPRQVGVEAIFLCSECNDLYTQL